MLKKEVDMLQKKGEMPLNDTQERFDGPPSILLGPLQRQPGSRPWSPANSRPPKQLSPANSRVQERGPSIHVKAGLTCSQPRRLFALQVEEGLANHLQEIEKLKQLHFGECMDMHMNISVRTCV